MTELFPRALALATVAKSLVFQAPAAWDVLRSLGYDLSFAARTDPYAGALHRWGQFQDVPLERSWKFATLDGVREVARLKRLDWDFVQVQSPIAAALWRSLPQASACPSVYIAHGLHATIDLPRHTRWTAAALETFLAGRSSAIAVVSAEDFALAQRLKWGHRTLVWRLPGAGVPVAGFRGPREGRTGTVLFCGELNRNKDVGFAVEVARSLIRAGQADRFVVIGDGPLEHLLHQGIELGWIDHIPYTDDVASFMRASDLLLHTSWREGLPRVLIESMAAGLPIIARENRGVRELIDDRVGRCMDRNATVEAWVREASRLLESPPDAEVMASSADRYDIEPFKAAYLDLVQSVRSGTQRGYVDTMAEGKP